MALEIAVCAKPVPDPQHYDRVTIDPAAKTITREGIPVIVNPVDRNALEAALRLREKHSGRVTLFCMAPPGAAEELRGLMAMGADRAFLLSDRAFAGADTFATSYVLAQAIRRVEREEGRKFDLVLCGCESADGATAQVSSQLGEWLEIPHLWNVFGMEEGDIREAETETETEGTKPGALRLKTKRENGWTEWEGRLPLLLGVSRELNRPRYVSVMGIVKAKNRPLTVWSRADLDGAEDRFIGLAGSPTRAGRIFSPDLKRAGKTLAGTPDEIAAGIVALLRANGIETGGAA